jgi:nuclear pore complex protein Nup155
VQTLTIPDAVIQASTSAQSFAAQGLFPEIERAWIIIDSQLFLWNYLEGSSSAFESYVHPTDIIQSVSLVAPKAGVFIDSIKHLLVISTQQSVTILGLAIETSPPPNAQRELRLYQTDFSLPTSGVVMRDFVATADGSRLFCRGSDACLYELYYQAKEGWFSSKCSLKNLTSGGVRNLLPGWAGGATKGEDESVNCRSSVKTC